jgi:hypothetical protein
LDSLSNDPLYLAALRAAMTSSIFSSLLYLKYQVFRARFLLLGAFEQFDVFFRHNGTPFF